jgi:hypothetical protein
MHAYFVVFCSLGENTFYYKERVLSFHSEALSNQKYLGHYENKIMRLLSTCQTTKFQHFFSKFGFTILSYTFMLANFETKQPTTSARPSAT